jgi:hypothetical protein
VTVHHRPWIVATAFAAFAGCSPASKDAGPIGDDQPKYDYPRDGELRLDAIQVKATHNSYHLEPKGNDLLAWDYTHAPLDVQCATQGVRQVELDVHFETGTLEVFHLKAIDDQTTCKRFTDCLAVLKGWSDANRGHHLLVVQMELKSGAVGDYEEIFARLHGDISSVWPEQRIVTPAMVKGSHASVAEALAKTGWPTLGKTRGKVMFVMDEKGAIQQAYTHGRKDLEGRLVFPDSDPGDPFAAVIVANEPIADAARIAKALSLKMLVRTRADADGVEAKANDTTRLKAALASGAHFISTDYPVKVPEREYWFDMPGGTPSRCNPVTAPKDCTSKDLENPAQLKTP